MSATMPRMVMNIRLMLPAVVTSGSRTKVDAPFRGDDLDLALWMRRHCNLVENVPVALLLTALFEARRLALPWLNAMGIVLLGAPLLHLVGQQNTRLTAVKLCYMKLSG